MAYATAEDVAVRWARDLTVEETALVEVRLEDVERMIRRRIPDLDVKVDIGVIDVYDLIQVESDCVLRLARNPEGYYSETDGNYTYQLQKGLTSGTLEITAEEWAMLGVSRNRLFYLDPNPMLDTYGETAAAPITPRSRQRRDVERFVEGPRGRQVVDWIRQIW
jgi:hypothetical protein